MTLLLQSQLCTRKSQLRCTAENGQEHAGREFIFVQEGTGLGQPLPWETSHTTPSRNQGLHISSSAWRGSWALAAGVEGRQEESGLLPSIRMGSPRDSVNEGCWVQSVCLGGGWPGWSPGPLACLLPSFHPVCSPQADGCWAQLGSPWCGLCFTCPWSSSVGAT